MTIETQNVTRRVTLSYIKGEVYSIPKWVSVKTKEVKAKLGNREALPSLAQAQETIANSLTPTVNRLAQEQAAKLKHLEKDKAAKAKALAKKHAAQKTLH